MKPSSRLKIMLFACAWSGAALLFLRAQGPAPQTAPVPPFGAPDRAPRFHPPPNPLMEALDTNHDGILSADEIANAANSLKKLDRNGDGQLTEDELRPPPPGERGGPPRPPGPPLLAGRDPSTADPAPRPPAAARLQRPPPRLEDDPVAARLDKAAPAASDRTPCPAAAPLSLFELLDTNHDGVLSEEELRDAPALLKRLDLKSIPVPGVGPAGRGDLRLPPP